MLKEICEVSLTVSSFAKYFSKKAKIAESTVKYNIYRLERFGFVTYKNSFPVKLTPLGMLAVEIFEKMKRVKNDGGVDSL